MYVAFFAVAFVVSAEAKPMGPERWEASIRKFEAEDKSSPVPSGGTLFVGSSSIRLWNLAESFPEKQFVNRGFGGCQISDVNHYIDRVVLVYKPKTIVFYAGDNDIAVKKSPERVAADFEQFVTRVLEKLPETEIKYIAIKPSLKRWGLWEQISDANGLIEAYCMRNDQCQYVDIVTPMLGDQGTPKPELFVKDGLHLSAQGYAVWTEAVKKCGVGN